MNYYECGMTAERHSLTRTLSQVGEGLKDKDISIAECGMGETR